MVARYWMYLSCLMSTIPTLGFLAIACASLKLEVHLLTEAKVHPFLRSVIVLFCFGFECCFIILSISDRMYVP